MASQPAPRPWFRLPTMARPATEPPAPQPIPAVVRPFRPIALPLPTQPQEPTPPPAPLPATASASPPPPAVTSAPSVAAPPPAPTPPASDVASVKISPTPRQAAGVTSVPTSPTPKAPSPSFPPATTSTMKAPAANSSSVPSSQKPRVTAPTSALPSSPAPKPAPNSPLVTTSPARKPAAPSSMPTSPGPKPIPTTVTTITRVPSPTISPKIVKTAVTPPPSPKLKSPAPLPSPLTLPPSQIKSHSETEPKIPLVAEPKTVVIQKMIENPKARFSSSDLQTDFRDTHKSSIARYEKQDGSMAEETKGKGQQKKISSDSEEMGPRVITIAGENRGAFMEVIRSPNKKNVFEGNPHHLHKNGNPKNNSNEWGSYSSTSSGEEGNLKDNSHKRRAMNALPMSAFMNSNIQGVNNSIIYSSACTHHDPGVKLSLSRKSAGAAGGFHIKDRGNDRQS